MSEQQGFESGEPNLEGMAPDDLMALVEAAIDRVPMERLGEVVSYVQERQRSRHDEERQRMLEKFREEAARFGMQVKLEPMGAPGRGRRGQSSGKMVQPKYRGPNGETWSGRGIPPKWLTALEA